MKQLEMVSSAMVRIINCVRVKLIPKMIACTLQKDIHYIAVANQQRMTHRFVIFIAFLAVLCSSCKKDRLEWKQVQKIETGTANRRNRVLFINNNKGFAAGGDRFLEANILATENGGDSWTLRNYPEAGKGLYGITQSPSGRILAVGFDGKILYSDDGGANWQFVQLSPWLSYKDVFLKA